MPSRSRPHRCFWIAAVAAVAVSGCGGAKHPGGSGTLPSCVHGRAPKPSDLPTGFPLPRATVVSSTSRESGARVVQAFTAGDLEEVRDFFYAQLPAKGFTLGEGDAEESEAETDFSGHGTSGHLKLNTSFDCKGAVAVAVVLRRS